MLTIGTRVILKPFEENPEERGRVVSYDPRDDGLREVPADPVF